MSLEQLIQRCKKNDRKAQQELYSLFASKLFATCLKYSRNKSEAEDNLQDSFITIYKKIGQYNGKGSFEGWLRRIAINTALQKYRGQAVFHIVNDNLVEEDENMTIEDHTPSLDYLLNIIQGLPDRYRLVFNLYVLDGYSHKEIAGMLNINEGTSKSNLARGRMILKEKITAQQALEKKNVNSL